MALVTSKDQKTSHTCLSLVLIDYVFRRKNNEEFPVAARILLIYLFALGRTWFKGRGRVTAEEDEVLFWLH